MRCLTASFARRRYALSVEGGGARGGGGDEDEEKEMEEGRKWSICQVLEAVEEDVQKDDEVEDQEVK